MINLQEIIRLLNPHIRGPELMILLSVFCKDTVTIHNTALEPEIDDLISFLNEGGAKIRRNGNDIVIEGVKSLIQKNPIPSSQTGMKQPRLLYLALSRKEM